MPKGLGEPNNRFCEVVHISLDFFAAGIFSRSFLVVPGLKGQAVVRAMIQQQAVVRSLAGSQLWLSMLVGAMEDASRPECRALPCARSTLAGLRAQLARPVPFHPQGTPRLSAAATDRRTIIATRRPF
jgi:hypothetical protein